jgi:hypothetical protein
MSDAPLLTRRRLVQAGGAATVALYLGGLGEQAIAAQAPDHLRRSAHAPLTGTTFAAGAATLTLLEVADLERARRERGLAGRDDAFALTFAGPPDAVLASGIHELRHEALGSFSVFIAPVGRAGTEQLYEVVVDRSVGAAQATSDAPKPLSQSPGAATTSSATATVAERGGELTADVRVPPEQGIVSVRGRLLRDGVEYARAGRLLRGRHGIRLVLRRLRRVAPGVYVLHVTTRDVRGRRRTTRRRVTIR